MSYAAYRDLVFFEHYDEGMAPTWEEKAFIKEKFFVYYNFLKSLGIRDSLYLYNILDDESFVPCCLLIWDSKCHQSYEQHNFLPIFQAKILSNKPHAPIYWQRPERFNSPIERAFYDLGAQHGKQHEVSYWMKDTIRNAACVSFSKPFEKLDSGNIWAAIGMSAALNKEIQSICAEAYRRKFALTETEEKYLRLFYEGNSRKDIVKFFDVSPNWVAKICMSVRRKLDVNSDIAAVSRCLDLRLLN